MVIYTGGTFDLFHAGHAEFLKRLNREGVVVVGLNTDAFVEEYKGVRPTNSYAERFQVLKACRYVNDVIENVGGADSRPAIELVKPQAVAIGSDWHGRDYLDQMSFSWEWLHTRGIMLIYVPRVTPFSSTGIRERLR